VVEMKDLFTEVKVFEESGSSRADFQAVLVIGDRSPLLRRECRDVFSGRLVKLAAFASNDPLVIQPKGFLIFGHNGGSLPNKGKSDL